MAVRTAEKEHSKTPGSEPKVVEGVLAWSHDFSFSNLGEEGM